MKKTTSADLQAQLNRLRRLGDAQRNGKPFIVPEGCVSRLDLIERRLLEAVRRDDTGTTERDGFPSGRPGAGGEDAGSTTETAAIHRAEEVAHADRHHVHTQAAVQALENAAQAVASLMVQLDAIDALVNKPKSDPSGSCLVCDRHVEGTSIDRLRRGMCAADYNAWIRDGRPELTAFRRVRRSEAA